MNKPSDRAAGGTESRPGIPLASANPTLQQACQTLQLIVERGSGQLVAINPEAASFFDIEVNKLSGLLLCDLLPDLDNSVDDRELDHNDKQARECYSAVRDKTGDSVHGKISLVPLLSETADTMLLTIQFPGDPLPHVSHRDALTGLPDRRELAVRFGAVRQRSENQISTQRPRPVAILFLDLDGFKAVNDQHGHAVGDQVLVALASRWQSCVRDDDLVARYGGDEFVVLLADIDTAEAARSIVDRLITSTAETITVNELGLKIGVTVGIAIGTEPSQSLDELVLEADRQMYAQKRYSDSD